MPLRRVDPRRIKLHRTYTVQELAACCHVHRNTVRHWQARGLQPLDDARPLLFLGSAAREFLTKRKASRKRSCPPGTLYCLRCRQPRAPALGMVDFVPVTAASGNLRALCEHCEAIMHRRVRRDGIAAVMPGSTIQFVEAPSRLSGRASPSLNCDSSKGR